MARKTKVKAEELPEEEQSLVTDAVAEEEASLPMEEISVEESPPIEETPIEEFPTEEQPKVLPLIVDNRMADVLFEKLYARSKDAYEYIIVTADLSYIRGRSATLFQFIMRMLKSGGKAKFPKSYFDNLSGAILEKNFWIVTKE